MSEIKWQAKWTMRCGEFEQMTVLGLVCDEKPYEAGPTERRLALKTLLGFMREGHEEHPFIEHFNDSEEGYVAVAEKPDIPESLTPESSNEEFAAANVVITREVRPYFGGEDA